MSMTKNSLPRITAILLGALLSYNLEADEYIKLSYPKWEIMYNCSKKGYEFFHYKTVPDTGTLPRYQPFHEENRLPKRCRQSSISSYKSTNSKLPSYDRGHGVHQNIFDHSKELQAETNSMANIVPQASLLNRRGVWRETEKLTECWRDKGTVEVWGGVVWGKDHSNDVFLKSHGVVTPDWLWKVAKFPNGEINAWLMPNDNSPTADKIDLYLTTTKRISYLTGLRFNFDAEPAEKSVKMPKNCSLS